MNELDLKSSNKSKRSAGGRFVEVLDIEKLDAAFPEKAVKRFELSKKARIKRCDLLIVGGGTGGVAAALTAAAAGLKVCLSEETSWLGGQLSTQGVSALDENYLVESSGATRSYKAFRNAIRAHYRALGAVDGAARFEPYLDPGNCWVSRLAFEPKVAVKILADLLKPYIEAGNLELFMRSQAFSIRKSEQKIKAVQCIDLDSAKVIEFRPRFCIDATELGALLPLANIEYRSGAESRQETGEAHAPEHANPENVQDYTYPFVLEFCPSENHCIEKPPFYDEFLQQ
ncbi:MAG: FAD-dependent oxidoreductase, partial [Candidatus Obscuribacterales bacterium]|nr:FAD-dependent oxidoreductase [Candidatus Obscuribacterales bacterium]